MKRVVYLFLSIIVVFSVACCSGSGGSKTVLAGIDTLADSRPDSALRLLAGMKRSMASASEAERNYYRLLLVKARDKAYIRHTSDSVILSLVDYYEHDGDKRLLPVAYYYAGRVYRDLNDAVKALKYFQKAENALAETGGSYSFEDKLHSQKGYLLIRQDLYAAALRDFDKAYKYTVERKDTNGIIFCLRDKGNLYYTVKDYDKALQYFDKALLLAKAVNDKSRETSIYIYKANCYFKNGNVGTAKKYITIAKSRIDSLNAKAIYTNLARIFSKIGDEDSSAFYYSKLGEINDVYAKREACLGLANYYSKYIRNSEKSIYYMNLFKAYSDSVQDMRATQVVADIDAKYNMKKNEERISYVMRQRDYVVVLSLAGLLVLLFVIYFMWRKKYRLTKGCDVEDVEKNKTQTSTFEPSNNDVDVSGQTDIRQIGIGDSAEQALRMSDIFNKLKDKLAANKSVSDKEWAELRCAVDTYLNNFTRRITAMHSLSDFELKVCILIKLDFKIKEIAVLTCHTPIAVTAARRRLYGKFFGKSGSPGEFDDFIRSL